MLPFDLINFVKKKGISFSLFCVTSAYRFHNFDMQTAHLRHLGSYLKFSKRRALWKFYSLAEKIVLKSLQIYESSQFTQSEAS